MFDKELYTKTFSKLKASDQTLVEVMKMASDKTRDYSVVRANDYSSAHTKPGFRKSIVIAAAVLIVCLLFGNMLLNRRVESVFAIKAYAMEIQADGSVVYREVDLFDQTRMWGGYTDGENLYLNIRLKYEGENIESVELTTEEGFFATQHLNMQDGKIVNDDTPILYVGESQAIVMYGTEFENVGNTLILNEDEMRDDLLLFIGTAYTEGQVTLNMTINAVATFGDGKKQEKVIELSFTRPGIIMTGEVTEDARWGEPDLGDAPFDWTVPQEQIPRSDERINPITGESMTQDGN